MELQDGEDFSLENIDDNSQPVDVSDPGRSLVCVTTEVNDQCCRGSDGDNTGDWFYPDGTIVLRQRTAGNAPFSRTGYTHQVRLNRKPNNGPFQFGIYQCIVPSHDRTQTFTISINLSK